MCIKKRKVRHVHEALDGERCGATSARSSSGDVAGLASALAAGSAARLLPAAALSALARRPVALMLPALSGTLTVTLPAVPLAAEVRRLTTRVSLSRRMTHRSMPIALLPLTAAVAVAPDRAAHGEIRFLAFRHLTFDTRQRRANQPAMDRPLVFAAGLVPAAAAASASARPAYGWPVTPFHRQHPVRAFFGDGRAG